MVNFQPTQVQIEPLESKARIKVLNAGRRSGKTLCWSIDDARVLTSGAYLVWCVAPTYELAERVWRVVAETLWLNKKNTQLAKYMTPIRKSEGPGARRAVFQNGAEFICLSAQDPDKSLLGAGVDRLHITEAARLQSKVFHEYLLPMIGDTQGKIVLDSTPRGSDWWKKLYDIGQDKTQNTIRSWKFPSWKNNKAFSLGINDPQIELWRKNMSSDQFAQEVEAEFITFQGRLVPEFSSENIISGQNIKQLIHNKKVYGGVDWGCTHPAVLVVGTYDERTQETIIFDEFVSSGLRVEELLAKASILNARYNVDTWYAGNDRPENKLALNDNGCDCEGAEDSHDIGIETLRVMCKNKKLKVTDNCTKVIESFQNCHRKEIKGVITEKWSDDYLDPLDASRYLCTSVRKQWTQPEGILDKVLGL